MNNHQPTPKISTATRFRATTRIFGRAALALLAIAASLVATAGTAHADTVSVNVSNGDLTIETDSGDNTVTLSTPSRGQVKIVVARSGGDFVQTKTNIRSVTVKLKGGADTLLIPGVFIIEADLKLELGGGSDNVQIGHGQADYTVANVLGDFIVTGSGGNDDISVAQTNFAGETFVNVGTGISAFATTRSTFAKDVTVRQNSSGRLRFDANGSNRFEGRLTVKGGGAADSVNLRKSTFLDQVVLNTQGANDAMSLRGNIFKDLLSVNLGGGRDHLIAAAGSFRAATKIVAGSGSDRLDIDGASFSDALTIEAGRGNDITHVVRTISDQAFTWRGAAGDDVISFGAVTFNGSVILNGGTNTDTLGGEAVTFNGPSPQISNIENQ